MLMPGAVSVHLAFWLGVPFGATSTHSEITPAVRPMRSTEVSVRQNRTTPLSFTRDQLAVVLPPAVDEDVQPSRSVSTKSGPLSPIFAWAGSAVAEVATEQAPPASMPTIARLDLSK